MNVRTLQDGATLLDVECNDLSAVIGRLAEAWPVIARAIGREMQKRVNDWDRVRAYARFESGLVWLALEGERPRRNGTVVGVKLACVEERYYALPDSEFDADAFERSHEVMSRQVYDALRESALSDLPRTALMNLQTVRVHPITFVEYDDLETERTLVSPAELSARASPSQAGLA